MANDIDGAPVARHGRGRRPADEVRADVLHTVGDLLLRRGLTGLTFECVARESGVSKTTLYKWWPSLGALALDGYFHGVQDTLAFPDTGDVRADVTTQLHQFLGLMTTTPAGRLLAELIGRSQTDPDLAREYRRLYSSGRRQLAADRFRIAQRAGQIRSEIDVRVVIDQLWGAMYHRLLVPDEPVNADFVDALIENVFAGITPARP
ncbi:TetR-like C-terminal domain-containing protein [Williamsia sterculiae]|uniref:DNA-binding transcriptional regulator, AcrR family n=1 Tax=Williamsia sterculiae TaxID=1344003 RepID=A0A1N7CBJ2_9NOCA|nr:TetR-like C-terminal domain-containing protein [Williamsia sterculiae]SIR61011.1 DNA-binding transcriptional regulator, AcrR family [Williamsia sterculiae]